MCIPIDIHCLWFDLSDMNISKIRYSCPMDKVRYSCMSTALSEREETEQACTILRFGIPEKAGFNACCIAVREKSFIDKPVEKGRFQKIRYVRYTKWFGKPACRVYQ